MKRPVSAILKEMDSRELTAWQAFFTWRSAEEKKRASERKFLGDDDEVITY